MTLDILQCCAKGDIEYLRGWIEVEEKPENLLDIKSNDGKSVMEIKLQLALVSKIFSKNSKN